MSDEFTVTTSGSPLTRVLDFLSAYRTAPPTADIEMRLGEAVSGDDKGVCISIDGEHHAFTLTEAKQISGVIGKTIQEHPAQSRREGLIKLRDGIETCIRLASTH